MEVQSGIAWPVANKGLPQVEQKRRVVRSPLDAWTQWVAGEPVTLRDCLGTTTPQAKGALLECWQSRQWQLSIASGSLEHS